MCIKINIIINYDIIINFEVNLIYNQAVFLHDRRSQDKNLHTRKELLRRNKKHFSSFFEGFYL